MSLEPSIINKCYIYNLIISQKERFQCKKYNFKMYKFTRKLPQPVKPLFTQKFLDSLNSF